MKPVSRHPILKFESDMEVDLGKPADRISYFSSALTTTAFFSYMSSLVLRKDRWDSAGTDDSFIGSCWGHVARIFRMIPDGLKVCFLPEDYLLNRGDNDSFLETGHVNRIAIAVDGYHRLGEVFFGEDSIEAYHMRRVLKKEYAMSYLLYTKLVTHEEGDERKQEKLESLVKKLYVDGSPTDRFRHGVYRLSPVFLLHIAAAASRRLHGLAR